MILLFLFVSVFGQDALIEERECFSSAEKKQIAPVIANRRVESDDPKVVEVRMQFQNWPSALLSSRLVEIIGKELLGYNVTQNTRRAGGGAEAWDWIGNGTDDIVIESWDYYESQKLKYSIQSANVAILGEIYTGLDSIFYNLPQDVLAKFRKSTPPSSYYSYFPQINGELIEEISALTKPTSILLKENKTFADIVRSACPDFPSDYDVSVPAKTFDPNGCLKADGNRAKACVEWMKPNLGWTYNIFEQIIRNLNLPVWITYWNLGPDPVATDDCPGWHAEYATLVNELSKQGRPAFYNWYSPDNTMNVRDPIFFKPEYFECISTHQGDNQDGIGGRDCLNAQTPLIKLGSPKLLQQEVYKELGNFLLAFDPTRKEILDLLDDYDANDSDDFAVACAFLKTNSNRTKNWVDGLNQYLPIESEWVDETFSFEMIALIAFGAVVLIAGTLYLIHTYGGIRLISKAVAAEDFYVSIVGITWKFIDFALTMVGLAEIRAAPTADWYRAAYYCFIGIHFVCFVISIYAFFLLFMFFYTNTVAEEEHDGTLRKTYIYSNNSQALTEWETVNYYYEKWSIKAVISLAGCFSFFLEDLLGSALTFWAIYDVPELGDSIIMFVCAGFQVLETGMSMNSIYSYGVEMQHVEIAKYKLDHIEASTGDLFEKNKKQRYIPILGA